MRRLALIIALLIAGSVSTVAVPATVAHASSSYCNPTYYRIQDKVAHFTVAGYSGTTIFYAYGNACYDRYYQLYVDTQPVPLRYDPPAIGIRVWVCGVYKGFYEPPGLNGQWSYLFNSAAFYYGTCGLQADDWSPPANATSYVVDSRSNLGYYINYLSF